MISLMKRIGGQFYFLEENLINQIEKKKIKNRQNGRNVTVTETLLPDTEVNRIYHKFCTKCCISNIKKKPTGKKIK